MSKFDEFFESHVNRAWDKYGRSWNISTPQWSDPYCGQCASLSVTYLRYLYPDKARSSYGNAIDYWNNRNSNGILDLCVVVNDLKDGDIVVSEGSMPQYGHIFIMKGGQAFTQNCASDPRALVKPLSWQGRIVGILRPKILMEEEKVNLIPEYRQATILSPHRINVRLGHPEGEVKRVAVPGEKIVYDNKVIFGSHRYISFMEDGKRCFMAVTPTREQKDHWVKIEAVPDKEPAASKNSLKDSIGIDISEHQRGANLAKAAADGVKFAIFRCSYGTITDKCFADFVKQAKACGLPILGVYVFDYSLTDQEAIEEAEHAVKLCQENGLDKSVVIFFDCEGDSVRYANQMGTVMDNEVVKRRTRLFCDTVKKHGYKTGFYANRDWMWNKYDMEKDNRYVEKPDEFRWYARYDFPNPEYQSDFLQYTSSGKVDGIPGLVDMNKLNIELGESITPETKTGYTLIPEHGNVIVLPGHNINIRKNAPDGEIVRQAGKDTTIEYDQKTVFGNHRYVSWKEGDTRLFMAISGSPERGKNMWCKVLEDEDYCVWVKDAVVKTGDTVKSVSCSVAVVPGTTSAFKNGCVYVPELGGLVPLEDVSEALDSGDGDVDDVISTLASRVVLNESRVTAVNEKLGLVQVNGYWVNAEPLVVRR